MLSVIIIICALPFNSSAANEVFVATNNMILPLTDAMPVKSGGVWYVDYTCLTSGDLKVSSSYNSDSRTLVLYTWDTTLVFNLDEHTAYNTSDNVIHSQSAFSSRGTFYVPAQFTASQLGFTYSYIDSVSCIRFRSTSTLTDVMFGYIVKSKLPELIAQYNASKAPASDGSSTTSPSTQPQSPSGNSSNSEEVTVQKRVFLTFDIRSGKNNDAILDALRRYKMHATFFLSGNTLIENDSSVRRMVIENHAIGISGLSGTAEIFKNPESAVDELNKTNDLLFEISRVKSRLVRVPGGSKNGLSSECANALINSGYRYWDWTLDANSGQTSPSANRISNTVINSLKKQTYSIVLLSDSPETVNALPRILKYLSDNNCVVSTLSILDTPTNQRNDLR